MLETRFPRPPGDIGNPATFNCDVLYRTVGGAAVDRIVAHEPLDHELLDAFIDGAKRLAGEGADLITTSCGFLYRHQRDIADAVDVPVVTSSLCCIPFLRSSLGSAQQIGVLTFDAPALGTMLSSLPAHDGLVLEGIAEGGALHTTIHQDLETLDLKRAEQECVEATRSLCARSARLGAVVLECTNLPPYRNAITRVCRCPVFDLPGLVATFSHGHSR